MLVTRVTVVNTRDRLVAIVASLLGGTALADLAGYSLEDASVVGLIAALSFLDPLFGEGGELVSEHVFGIEIVPGLLETVDFLIGQAAAADMVGFIAVASGTFLLLRAADLAYRGRIGD